MEYEVKRTKWMNRVKTFFFFWIDKKKTSQYVNWIRFCFCKPGFWMRKNSANLGRNTRRICKTTPGGGTKELLFHPFPVSGCWTKCTWKPQTNLHTWILWAQNDAVYDSRPKVRRLAATKSSALGTEKDDSSLVLLLTILVKTKPGTTVWTMTPLPLSSYSKSRENLITKAYVVEREREMKRQ